MSPAAARKLAYTGSLALAALCLAGGYGLAGRWEGLLVVILLSLAGITTRRAGTWLPSALLAAYLGSAAAALLFSLPPALFVLGGSAALAAWDLALFARSQVGGPPEQSARLEAAHLRSLGLALGLGLLLAGAGAITRLQLPFLVMLVLALLGLWGFNQALRFLFRRN